MTHSSTIQSWLYLFGITTCCLGFQCSDDEPIPDCERAPQDFVQYFHPTCEVRPHKLRYQVGDTITFFTNTSDQFVDSASGAFFDMSPFPLRPVHSLMKVDVSTNNHFYGYSILPFWVDSIYQPELLPISRRDQVMRMWAVHHEREGRFRAEVTFVLTEPGRYISRWWDVYTVTRASEFGDLTYVDTIPLPDLCEGHIFDIRSSFVGDDNFQHVIPELIYQDSLYNGLHVSLRKFQFPSAHPLREGRRVLEWGGFFGFVVED